MAEYYTNTTAGRIEVLYVDAAKKFCKIYIKYETDKNCIFKKSNSLSITAVILETVDYVRIYLTELNTVIQASKIDIKAFKEVRTYNREVKYYYPCAKWEVLSGNKEWWKVYI